MEAVEISVYILVAIAVGVLLLSFLTSWNVADTYDAIRRLMTKEKTPRFETVDKEGFVASAFAFWESCGFGEVDRSLALYIDDTGVMSKEYLFEKVKKLNLCDSMQSAAYSCGRQESVIFDQFIPLPAVVRLQCNSTTEKLRIG